LLEPLTVAVNCCVPLVTSEADAGEIETETCELETEAAEVTVTAADADTVLGAMLVAVTTKLPALMGAVYIPPEVMLPPLADHVTPVWAQPRTVAVNCWVWPASTETEPGDRVTLADGVAAWLPNKVQPASDRAIRETIATMQIFARNSRGTRCLGGVMLFPLFMSSQS